MKQQTVLGFDFGMKHIGVAVGQTVTATANPLEALKAKKGEPEWYKITALIKNWRPDALVVGMPVALDGSDQEITRCAKRFAEALRQLYDLPVYGVDERYTTQEAKQVLFAQGGFRALKKSHIDGWSAKIITESALRLWDSIISSPPKT